MSDIKISKEDRDKMISLLKKEKFEEFVKFLHPNIDTYGHDTYRPIARNIIDKYDMYWTMIDSDSHAFNRRDWENMLNYQQSSVNSFYGTCQKCGKTIHYSKRNGEELKPFNLVNGVIPPCIEDKEYTFKIYNESGRFVIANNLSQYMKSPFVKPDMFKYSFSILQEQIDLRNEFAKQNVFIGYTANESIKVTKYGGNINFKPDDGYSRKNTLNEGFFVMATDFNNVDMDALFDSGDDCLVFDVEPNCYYEFSFNDVECTKYKLKKV